MTYAMRWIGKLREVGLVALYRASGASDYMTGQTLCRWMED